MIGWRRLKRVASRKGHRNGTYLSRLLPSTGQIDVWVPPSREGGSPADVIDRCTLHRCIAQTRMSTPMGNEIRMVHAVLLAGLLAACGGEDPVGTLEARPPSSFEAGPLGAVEVGEGEAVQIRSLLAHTGALSANISETPGTFGITEGGGGGWRW